MALVKCGSRTERSPTTQEIEIAVAHHFNPRVNLVVPNVSWGMFVHECDLLVMTRAGYCYEVEIKVSRSDLMRDKLKPHGHNHRLLKRLYFAIPDKLLRDAEHIPARAGILVVVGVDHEPGWAVRVEREADDQECRPLSDHERYQVARLGALRVFGLKQSIVRLQQEKRHYISQQRKAETVRPSEESTEIEPAIENAEASASADNNGTTPLENPSADCMEEAERLRLGRPTA